MPASVIVELIAFAIFAFCLFGAGLQLLVMIIRPPKREDVLGHPPHGGPSDDQ